MKMYTQQSSRLNLHVIPLINFADKNGNMPFDGQFVPQEVIETLALYEQLLQKWNLHHLSPEQLKCVQVAISYEGAAKNEQ